MKYSLRSLMIVVILGTPLLALAIVSLPSILERLPARKTAPPVPQAKVAAPKPIALPPNWTDDPRDYNTPRPALLDRLEGDGR